MCMRCVLLAVLLVTLAAPTTGIAGEQHDRATAAYKASLLAHKRRVAPGIVERPSSLVHCVTANTAAVHDLGAVPANTTVRIRFESDFDPVAAIIALQIGEDAPGDALTNVRTFSDDDSGGNLEPELNFTTPFEGSYTLHVADASDTAPLEGGCYVYELTAQLPGTATTSIR